MLKFYMKEHRPKVPHKGACLYLRFLTKELGLEIHKKKPESEIPTKEYGSYILHKGTGPEILCKKPGLEIPHRRA